MVNKESLKNSLRNLILLRSFAKGTTYQEELLKFRDQLKERVKQGQHERPEISDQEDMVKENT